MSGFRTSIGGVATVHCVHDRVKRELTDPEEFRFLFQASYGRAPNVVLLCGCCGNLFESLNDTPVNCKTCTGPTVHTLEAPVSAPIEGAI